MELLDRVERTISEQDLLPDGATVLVAVSGGSDSLAMLDLLGRLAPRHGWRLHVATFDHRWGPHGIEAVELVRRAAAERGLPCLADAAAEPTAGEAAARCQRHAFLERAAEQVAAEAIALAHTADDRAETLLLNLLRGAGTTGLGTLPARAGRLVRPLLECRREELREHLARHAVRWLDDPSNADQRFERNRIRRRLLPLLDELRPGAVAALVRSARLCAAEREVLDRRAEELVASRALVAPPETFLGGLRHLLFDCSGWRRMGQGERWLLLRRAAELIRGEREGLTLEVICRLDALAGGRPDAAPLALAGVLAARCRAGLVILPEWADVPDWGPLPVAGERTEAPAAGLAVVTGELAPGAALTARLRLPDGLWIRSWRPGDRLRPSGRGGSRAVADLMHELGVPRPLRRRVPLLGHGDQVIWLPGVPPAEGWSGPVTVGIEFAAATESAGSGL